MGALQTVSFVTAWCAVHGKKGQPRYWVWYGPKASLGIVEAFYPGGGGDPSSKGSECPLSGEVAEEHPGPGTQAGVPTEPGRLQQSFLARIRQEQALETDTP